MMRICIVVAALVGCANEPVLSPGVPNDAGEDVFVEDAASDSSPQPDVHDAAVDVAPFPVRRLPCVARESLARDLPITTYGALEAELVSIVPPGTKGCPADPDHLHLQVVVASKRYDIAITIDSSFGAPLALHTKTVTPTLPPEGFAIASFDYEKDIGTPSADYQAMTRAALLSRLQTLLADAARVRIFGRTYSDGSGVHNVHRNGRDRDGVVLVHRVEPSGADRAIAIRFASDVF